MPLVKEDEGLTDAEAFLLSVEGALSSCRLPVLPSAPRISMQHNWKRRLYMVSEKTIWLHLRFGVQMKDNIKQRESGRRISAKNKQSQPEGASAVFMRQTT